MTDPSNLLRAYLDYTSVSESPEIFHVWCGIFTISACLGRRCWVDLGIIQHYPNLYVVLIAESGTQRKSTAIKISRRFLSDLNPGPNLVADAPTPPALFDALRMKNDLSGKAVLRDRVEGVAIVDEMITFFSEQNKSMGLLGYLTKLYDGDTLTYQTKSGGSQPMKNACFGILGGATLAFVREAIPPAMVGTGVTSRMCFVYSNELTRAVCWPTRRIDLEQVIMKGLERVCSLQGQFTLNEAARDYYDTHYPQWRDDNPFRSQPALQGYSDRRWDLVFKISMILSVARDSSLIILKEDMLVAEQMLRTIEDRLPMLMRLIMSSEQGNLLASLEGMIHAGMNTRSQLVEAMSNRVNARELDVLLETLEQSGRFTKVIGGQDGTSFKPVSAIKANDPAAMQALKDLLRRNV